jgi:asparagine synthase (glutamine-hydrolysing)
MCGIAAIVSPGPAVAPQAIASMTRSLGHRGPDAQETVALPGCHLGHARLSVIDVVGGRQPMTEETRRYWIVFNGEIFNYRELRDELAALGWSFRTESDTEVLLRAYQQFGRDVPARLNGQFAFLVWDAAERRAFLARDRFGEKPLYWARAADGGLIVASEIKGILASGLVRPVIDRGSVDAYLRLLYVPPDRTVYENVATLRPGHAMSVEGDRCSAWEYWRPRYSTQRIDAAEAVERVRALARRAVKRQMVADVPIGAFLSGGLDSSTIVAFMAGEARQPVRTFSVGFGGLIDELPYAREVAHAYGTEHHELQVDVPVRETLEELAGVYDEPFADSSSIPTYLLAKFVRRHVKVALSGDGGDELFGGYEWYLRPGLLEQARGDDAALWLLRIQALFWRALARTGAPVQSRRDASVARLGGARERQRCPDLWHRHVSGNMYMRRAEAETLGAGLHDSVEALHATYAPGAEILGMDRATDFDVRCYLPGDILVKVDRAAMANGLETRAPFLDVDLAEFVLGLPWQLRFSGAELKQLMRSAFAQSWPAAVRARGKQGFGAPVASWLRDPGVQEIVRRVCSGGGPLAALLPGVAAAVAGMTAQQAWTVLCLGLWLERHPECHGSL